MKRKNSSTLTRLVNAVSSLALLVSLIVLFVWGFGIIAISTTVASTCCLVVPVVLSGDAVLEILAGIVEAFVEGIVAVIEGIVSAITGIFSF